MKHATHKEHLTRLRRIEGQVQGLSRMIEEERYCIDILTQIRAVQAALRKVELKVLEDHVQHCVTAAAESGKTKERDAKLSELFDAIERFGPR